MVPSLEVWENRLTGPIPPELGNLSNLVDLQLDQNELSGEIPPELGNLSNLENLEIWENRLTGSIPPELGNLTNLVYLWIRENELTGCVPSALESAYWEDDYPICDAGDPTPPAPQPPTPPAPPAAPTPPLPPAPPAATPTPTPPAATPTPPTTTAATPTPTSGLQGFSRVALPTLEPPPAGSIKSDLTLADPQDLQYLYQSGPKEEITPPFREGGGDRAHYWWIFMPPFHFASIANDMELRQGFATGYSVSDDGTEYLLHINPDAVFQDGTSITAQSVKDAWEFAAWPDNQVGWGAILLHSRAVQGMDEVENGDTTEASGLEVIDDQTLSIKLKQFTPTWPLQLGVWMFGMYKADQGKNDPETFRTNPIGAGPYRAAYDDATDTQYYTRADNYWGESPFMDRVVRPTVRDLQTRLPAV